MFIRLHKDTERPHDVLIYWRAVQEIEKVTFSSGEKGWTVVRTTVGTHSVKEEPSEIIGLIESARDLELRDAAHSKSVCSA